MKPNPPLTAIGEPAENPDGSESTVSEGDTAYMFPRSLPLAVERVEDIGCQALTISERVPEGGDVLFSGSSGVLTLTAPGWKSAGQTRCRRTEPPSGKSGLSG